MNKTLHCTACGAQLTTSLTILSRKDPAVTQPIFEDGKPLSEPGSCFKSYEPIERSLSGDPVPLDFIPQYWLNPDDLTKAVKMTADGRRLNGCCGPAGSNGPNQKCQCGAEVGTLQADCWTSRVFIPQPDTTLWTEEQ
ncbi:hypothetical protein ACVWZA_000783 [Sphingomonas sp. UYAg733]